MVALSRVASMEMEKKWLNSGYNLKENAVYILYDLKNISK